MSESKKERSSSMDNYKKIREVGSGTFGKALLVKDMQGRQFIMKSIDISKMSSKERKDAINEVKVLSSLKHPYIISYRESFIDRGHLNIVMDYAEGGDLYTRIQKQKRMGKPFSEQQILRWFTQACLALKYLHDKHILHRDLKSQNFFLTASGRLRMGDFGISKVLESTAAFAKTTIGTPYYLSPEICEEKPYSWSSDLWALGCILYEMAALKVPFDASNIRQLVEKITRGPTPQIPSSFSQPLRQMALDLLHRDSRKRPAAADILQREVVQEEIRRMLKEEQAKRAEHMVSDVKDSKETKESRPRTDSRPRADSSAGPATRESSRGERDRGDRGDKKDTEKSKRDESTSKNTAVNQSD
eukprot:Platyproteum_vivax@DN10544_c0_g1_i1.p1